MFGERKKIELGYTAQVHLGREPDEYYHWELDDDGKPRWSDKTHVNIHYAIYEVIADLEIMPSKETAEVIRFRVGEDVYEKVR